MTVLKEDIRRKYDKVSPWYDLLEAVPADFLGLKRLRRRLLSHAAGRTLEIGAGTGRNLPLYPGSCSLTAIDLSSGMLEIARKRAERLGLTVTFSVMDAESLDFPDQSFDTVVDSLSLCTFPDPVAALREMARVCRQGGRILLLEHGRSNREWLGRWQDRREESHAKRLGCRWNREPLDLVRKAGLTPNNAERAFFGIFHLIEIRR